jgi:hypothetical protein
MLPSSVAYFSFSDFNNHEMDDRHYGKISENNGLSNTPIANLTKVRDAKPQDLRCWLKRYDSLAAVCRKYKTCLSMDRFCFFTILSALL